MDSMDTLAASPNPSREPGVKTMVGDWHGWLRVTIGGYRAIFRLQPRETGSETLFVIFVGPRGDVY